MFPLRRAAAEVTWKAIEDDFVLGACTRRILGYASRGVDRVWTAFDDDARPLGRFVRLPDAKTALWTAHRDAHDRVCTKPHDRSAPRRPDSAGPASDRLASGARPLDGASHASW